jgi:hypothetical protein
VSGFGSAGEPAVERARVRRSGRDGLASFLEGSRMLDDLKTTRDLWEATVHYRRLAAFAPETEAAEELRRLAARCERRLRDLESDPDGRKNDGDE